MSKGSPVVHCRLPRDLHDAVLADLAKRNQSALHPEQLLADWLVSAVREYLRKRKAGRKPRSARRRKEVANDAG